MPLVHIWRIYPSLSRAGTWSVCPATLPPSPSLEARVVGCDDKVDLQLAMAQAIERPQDPLPEPGIQPALVVRGRDRDAQQVPELAQRVGRLQPCVVVLARDDML